MIKKRLQREMVSCLDDLAVVVEVLAETNVTELVGREDSTHYIPVYNWSEFLLPHFMKVPNFKYHHVTFSSEVPSIYLVL